MTLSMSLTSFGMSFPDMNIPPSFRGVFVLASCLEVQSTLLRSEIQVTYDTVKDVNMTERSCLSTSDVRCQTFRIMYEFKRVE